MEIANIKMEGYLVTMDNEKAFYSLSQKFLISSLEKRFYEEIRSRVLVLITVAQLQSIFHLGEASVKVTET